MARAAKKDPRDISEVELTGFYGIGCRGEEEGRSENGNSISTLGR